MTNVDDADVRAPVMVVRSMPPRRHERV